MRKSGKGGGEAAEAKKGRKFYPDYLSEIIVTALVASELLLILVLLYPPATGREIDFTRQFQPRPEWYFLWLFQLVGYFPGKTVVIGTVIVPVLYVSLFMMLPYIDRGNKGRLRASLIAVSLFLVFVVLTLVSVW